MQPRLPDAERGSDPFIDSHWDDDGVLPDQLGPDTEYLFERMTSETLEALDIASGEKVLDIGCGRGHDLASLHSSGAVLYGCDGSHVMIGKAKRTFQGNGLTPTLSCGRAEHLPFRDESFDKVYCKGAVDHFYDPWSALREMVRVLRPGGRVVISVANFESLGCRLGKLYNRIHRALKGRELPKPHFWELPEDHVYRFDRAFLLKTLPRGISVEREWGISILWGVPRWGEWLSALPERVSKRILRTLDRLASRLPALADVIVIRAQRPPHSESRMAFPGC